MDIELILKEKWYDPEWFYRHTEPETIIDSDVNWVMSDSQKRDLLKFAAKYTNSLIHGIK